MRLTIAAVGRLRAGSEALLTNDYLARIDGIGRPIGLGPARVVEVDERKARDRDRQAEALLAMVPDGAWTVALDERGRMMASDAFAARLGTLRDEGRSDVVFLIGGADGHGAEIAKRAGEQLALGPMVWPHMLVRAMLAEQLYRAVSILAGTPYHRA